MLVAKYADRMVGLFRRYLHIQAGHFAVFVDQQQSPNVIITDRSCPSVNCQQ